MRVRRGRALLVILAAIASGAAASARLQAAASGWPQWLGPSQNGTAVDPGAFAGKPSLRLKKAWSRPLETGQAGLSIGDGRVFTLFRSEGDDFTIALRADDGEVDWRVKLDKGIESPWVSGPPSTPAFDDGRVFTLSAACRLRAHDAATGRTLWDVDVKEKFGAVFPIGCASSPFVLSGRLYVQTGGRAEHRFAAFDPKTGDVLWTSKAAERSVNASPIAADIGGVRQILVHHAAANGQLGITGLRLSDGALLWSANVVSGFSFETPQALPGNRVLIQTVNDLHVLRVTRTGDAWSTAPLWRTADLQAFVSPPVLHDRHLFGLGGDHLVCVELESGKTVWKEKTYAASVILVDGHLVVLSSSAGFLRVVEASASGYREKSRIEVFHAGAQALAPPSYAGRRIFARNEEEVVAVDVF